MIRFMTNYGSILAGDDQERDNMVAAVLNNGGRFLKQKSINTKIIRKIIEVSYVPKILRKTIVSNAKYYLVFKAKDEDTAKRCLYAAVQASNGLGFY
ncbi:MAG: hypothetical protein J6Y02_06525 [Pseudobutyrivibrio sp.]|nr:hypothetical protein [Pseudobutyrivibrio sp.]